MFSVDRPLSILSKTSRPRKKKKTQLKQAEIRDCPDLPSRVSTAVRKARILAEEFAGQLALVPFAVRALSERRRAKKEGRLVEGVRYGPRARQVADIWLPPPQEEKKTREEEKERRPPAIAVLFHGGTWTAGDKV